MTYRDGRSAFPVSVPGALRGAAAALLLTALAGCSTAAPESAVPASGQAESVGPKDTGTFPNLNIAPQRAAPQLTDAETKAKLARLDAERAATQRSAAGSGADASAAALRSLAANHGKDTLREIEEAPSKCDPALDPTCK